MVIKKCKICGNEFEGHNSAKYCSDECRKAGKKITDKRYGNNTPEQWMEFIEKQYGGD